MDQTQEDLKLHIEAHKLDAAASAPDPAVNQAVGGTPPTVAPNRTPKAVSPTVEMDITDQDWKYFLGRWNIYKT